MTLPEKWCVRHHFAPYRQIFLQNLLFFYNFVANSDIFKKNFSFMELSSLRGMGVALTTPFMPDESIDYDTLDFHIDYLIESGADYIVALGTTAETPTLSKEEKKKLEKHILDRVAGRIPVVVGIGGNNTRALIEEIIRECGPVNR